jgi:hypothetical protein
VITLLPDGSCRVKTSRSDYQRSVCTVDLLVDQEIGIAIPLLPQISTERIKAAAGSGPVYG